MRMHSRAGPRPLRPCSASHAGGSTYCCVPCPPSCCCSTSCAHHSYIQLRLSELSGLAAGVLLRASCSRLRLLLLTLPLAQRQPRCLQLLPRPPASTMQQAPWLQRLRWAAQHRHQQQLSLLLLPALQPLLQVDGLGPQLGLQPGLPCWEAPLLLFAPR